jgi:DNA repair exonuclease SbcCD ATPase subunit
MTEIQEREELQVLREALGDASDRFAGLEAKIASANRSFAAQLAEIQARAADRVEQAERELTMTREELATAQEELASERGAQEEARREAEEQARLLDAARKQEAELAARVRELSKAAEEQSRHAEAQSELIARRDRELVSSRQDLERLEGKLKEATAAQRTLGEVRKEATELAWALEAEREQMVSFKVKVKRKLDELTAKLEAERERNLAAEAEIEELKLELGTALTRARTALARAGAAPELGSALESERRSATAAITRLEELPGERTATEGPQRQRAHAREDIRPRVRSEAEREPGTGPDGHSARWGRRTHWASLRRWFRA